MELNDFLGGWIVWVQVLGCAWGLEEKLAALVVVKTSQQ